MVCDDDVNLALGNLAVFNFDMYQQIVINYSFYVVGISYGYVVFGYYFDFLGLIFYLGVQYISYGIFDEINDWGEVLGIFDVVEYVINFGVGK